MTCDDKFMQVIEDLAENNTEFKQVFDILSSAMGSGFNELTEVKVVEIDGANYIVAKEFLIGGITHIHLCKEDNPMDIIYAKKVIEDGKESLVSLESEEEIALAVAYEQKYFWQDIQRIKNITSETE